MPHDFHLRSTLRLAVLLVAGLAPMGCLTEPPGPALNQLDVPTPPVTLEWVGRYVGTAAGTYDGVQRENVPVEILITFDSPKLDTCGDCITVRVEGYFSQMNLLPQSPIAATWSYLADGEIAMLRMEKFSSSAAPGSVFFGSVSRGPQAADGSMGEPTVSFDFVVERQ